MTSAAFFIGRRRDDFKFTLDVCDRTRCVFLAETRNEIVLSIPRTLDVSPRVTPLACIRSHSPARVLFAVILPRELQHALALPLPVCCVNGGH